LLGDAEIVEITGVAVWGFDFENFFIGGVELDGCN